MSPQLKSIIDDVQELSTGEQIELITFVTKLLESNYFQLLVNNDFWKSKSLKHLLEKQKVSSVRVLSDLAADFWPEDESADQFNKFIYKQGQEDRNS